MHQALLIYEILLEIFKHVTGPTLKSKNRATSVVARVCLAWKEPALDAAWENLPNPWILFDSVFGISLGGPGSVLIDSPTVTTQIERLSQLSWQRFDSYARRVKRLQYDVGGERDRMRASIMERFTQSRAPIGELKPLFPSLLVLGTSISDGLNVPLLLCFMSPRLRSLNISNPNELPFPDQLIKVMDLCPGIQNIGFQVDSITEHTTPLPHAMHAILHSSCSLKRLYIHPRFIPHAMQLLSQIATLEHLDWRRSSCMLRDFTLTKEYPGGFPSLQRVSGRIFGVENTLNLFSTLRPTKLRQIESLSVTNKVITASMVRSLLEAVSNLASSLETIKIHFLSVTREAHGQAPSFAEIEPLSKCSHLCTLHLQTLTNDFTYWLNISDKEFDYLVKNMPLLKDISLHYNVFKPQNVPSLTLACLQSLVRHCRDIQHVQMALDARQPTYLAITRNEDILPLIQPLEYLTSIDVGTSPDPNEDDIDPIVSYIRSLSAHPHLTLIPDIRVWLPTPTWREVARLVREPRVMPPKSWRMVTRENS